MQLRESKGRMFRSVNWTATYFQGCNHDCVYCWTKFMPWGPISHEPKLMQKDEHYIIKNKTGVCFLNSAHDSYSACIPDEWICAMHRWIGRQPDGLVFYLQSQNVWRAQQFIPQLKEIQDKVIIGTTIQTDNEALIRAISNAPSIYSRYQAMRHFSIQGFRVRLSLEPLFNFKPSKMRDMIFDINPELVEIGLDAYAHKHKIKIPQPYRKPYQHLYKDLIDYGITVFEKQGMERWRKTGRLP
ncbi:hypothetical protein ES703_87002 [subsurface metagenome]